MFGGLIVSGQKKSPRGTSEELDVKFEEEPYDDEDWFLMLLSELLFDKLKLEKPRIDLGYVPLVEEEEGELLTDEVLSAPV